MGYEQLLLHLFGDYITQTNWMANNKRKHLWPATVHSLVYAIPFWFLIPMSGAAFMTIWLSHLFIDHFALARYVVFVKNWFNEPELKWADCNKTGYLNDMPIWMSTWLLIITDNTLHLLINYAAIRWL